MAFDRSFGLRAAWLALFAVVALTGGCQSAAIEPGDVQRQWTSTFRQLGIQPIYPPREDVQVGDIYLRRGNPADARLVARDQAVPLDVLLAHVDVRTELTKFYGGRSAFAGTPSGALAGTPSGALAASPSFDAAAPGAETAPSDGTTAIMVPRLAPNTFEHGDLTAMRQVAFPEFSTVTVRGFGLSALVPIEAMTLAIGVESDSIERVDLKIVGGESCALPALTVLGRIARSTADGWMLRPESGIDPKVLSALLEGQREFGAVADAFGRPGKDALVRSRDVYLDVITEVYYARTIDIAVQGQSAFGARGELASIDAAKLLGDDAGDEVIPAEGEALTSYQRATKLNRGLASKTSRLQVGGSLQYTSVSDSLIAMRRTFERPIAVGFRGMTIAVDPTTGRIRGSGASAAAQGTAGTTTAQYDALAKAAAAALDVEQVMFATSGSIVRVRPKRDGVVGSADDYAALLAEQRERILDDATLGRGPDFFAEPVLTRFRTTTWTVRVLPVE